MSECKDCGKPVKIMQVYCDKCLQRREQNFKPYSTTCKLCGEKTAYVEKFAKIEWCEDCIRSAEEADRQADKMQTAMENSLQGLMIDDR